jgi:hypothetical protein
MGLKQRYSSQSTEVKAAVVAGLLALFGAIVAGAFGLANTELGKAATAGTPSAASGAIATDPASPAAGTCTSMLSLTGPSEDSSFTSGKNKALPITGIACDLGNDTGWLFDYDSDDHYYYDDYNGNSPVAAVPASHSGGWEYPDGGIGDSGDQRKPYTITLVLATPSCAKQLLTTSPIDGDYKWKAFPRGCTVAGKRDVYVTYP